MLHADQGSLGQTRASVLVGVIGAFESTYMPHHDVDVFTTTGHDRRWQKDLALLRAAGVSRLRYPVRWHHIEQQPGRFDWADSDQRLQYLRSIGLTPVLDLVHHTSYPRWLSGGFADPRWPGAFLRFAEQVAERYPWIEEYTLFNEPFATLHLAGHEGVWPPHLTGVTGFVELARNVMPAVAEASRRLHKLLPSARHVWVDTCERHSGAADSPSGQAYAHFANDRRFLLLDLFLGMPLQGDLPFVQAVRRAGGGDLLEMEPGHVDVLGLDFYAHSQWHFGNRRGISPSPTPAPLSELIAEYHSRYRLPCILAETNIRGYASDRATWLKYTLEQCQLAAASGVPMAGYCWFPFIDSADWDSLLTEHNGSLDPVGVYWLDAQLNRRPSSMSRSYLLAAAGASASLLPAYHLQEPVRSQLRGFQEHMSHWEWQPPPAHELHPATPIRRNHAVA